MSAPSRSRRRWHTSGSAGICGWGGHDQDALPVYRRAVELLPEAPPSPERALVLAAEGQVLMLCNRPEESSVRCAEALMIARAVGAEAVEAHVLNTICGNLTAVGDLDA